MHDTWTYQRTLIVLLVTCIYKFCKLNEQTFMLKIYHLDRCNKAFKHIYDIESHTEKLLKVEVHTCNLIIYEKFNKSKILPGLGVKHVKCINKQIFENCLKYILRNIRSVPFADARKRKSYSNEYILLLKIIM